MNMQEHVVNTWVRKVGYACCNVCGQRVSWPFVPEYFNGNCGECPFKLQCMASEDSCMLTKIHLCHGCSKRWELIGFDGKNTEWQERIPPYKKAIV